MRVHKSRVCACVQPVRRGPRTEPSLASVLLSMSRPADADFLLNDYMSVIRQQTSIGCWKLNVELSHSLNISLDQLHSAAPVKVRYVYVRQVNGVKLAVYCFHFCQCVCP